MVESAGTINDGLLRIDMTLSDGEFGDLPGSYHDNGLSCSFADGHAVPQMVDSLERTVWPRATHCLRAGLRQSTGRGE